jgi:hypothetical protein
MAAQARAKNGEGDQIAMKILPGTERMRSAFSLVECLLYIAVFFVILGLALGAYFQMDEQSRGFARNSSDIVRTMQAGERWRADVRLATAPPLLDETGLLRIAQKEGQVRYSFRDQTVWRQSPGEKAPMAVLQNVKGSAMAVETRSHAKAWRWEIELQTKRTNATLRPLFTFLAAPTTTEAPR